MGSEMCIRDSYSVEEGETITFLDLMRRGIQEKYQLGEKNERGTIS